MLTILEALAVHAVPHRKRQDTAINVVVSDIETVTVDCAPLTPSPPSAAGTDFKAPQQTIVRASRSTHVTVCRTKQSQGELVSASASISSLNTTKVAPSVPVPKILPTQTPDGIFFGSAGISSVSTSTVIPSISISIISTTLGTAQSLPSLKTTEPSALGTVFTSLYKPEAVTSGPLLSTLISTPTTILSATGPATTPTNTVITSMTSQDIFQPIATDTPPNVIGSRSDHPVPRLGITPQNNPIGTNKFYQNFFLGNQTSGTWTHPYSVAWSKGGGASGSWGLSIQHIDPSQRVYGPGNPVSYFINPVGIQSIILSASELGASTTLTMDTLTGFSANINLSPSQGAAPAIRFPLVQGMGFVTGIYNGGTPLLQTGVSFRSITKAAKTPKTGITKYTIILDDGKTWLLYAFSSDGKDLAFTVVNNSLAQATSNFNGVIQIAKSPSAAAEAMYDVTCGTWSTTVGLSGGVNGVTGSYTLSFEKAGLANTTLAMFALPHHVESFSPATQAALTSIQLSTTTKGNATAVLADSWTLVENLPTTMDFAPWSPAHGKVGTLSVAAKNAIQSIAASEISQDMNAQTNLDSMYFSGKVCALFLCK